MIGILVALAKHAVAWARADRCFSIYSIAGVQCRCNRYDGHHGNHRGRRKSIVGNGEFTVDVEWPK